MTVVEHEVEGAIVLDENGRVVHNAFQMDDPVIVRDHADGMRHLLSKRTGRLIIAPFSPQTQERMRCPHCQGELGGEPAVRTGER